MSEEDPSVVVDNTPFPDPSLYFRVFDSERDEPRSKTREDVLKLYERWQAKYGRKWPENGLNTEDLVWLYNEAYADEEQQQAAARAAANAPRTYPCEKEEYDGQFITATEDAAEEALASLPADPAKRAEALRQAKADMADGVWLTDEFESEAYEMGNLEALHGMYLWDKEGKPTIMPDGPPKEEAGEGSEGWSDFYGSLRPRHVASEDVRDALWATDEFESDEDNTESEWEPEYVGAGLGLIPEDPMNWQYSLRHSNHPLAPFPGEPLRWSSYVYEDGTTYEGISRQDVPHGPGVMVFGHGTGGGFHFRDVRVGDTYEGEFQAGYAHGLGQFTSPDSGEVFLGEFFAGQRHGCGMKVNMGPFYYLLQRGLDPVSAYQRTYKAIMKDIEFRTWYRGQPLGDSGEAESVLVAVRDADAASPWDVLTRNTAHEQKLRTWKDSSREERAFDKLASVLQQLHSDKHGWGSRYRGSGNDVTLAEVGGLGITSAHASEDSIELMVGRDEDGKLGPGWIDATDSELYPLDERLRTQVAVEALQDKIDESEDKEAILGADILNPTTGLSLKDYLEGREADHNELMARTILGRSWNEDTTSFVTPQDLRDVPSVQLGAVTEDLLLDSMRAHEAVWAEDDPYAPRSRAAARNWAAEDTDTRFETESDMMELCDLAEILGTVDEVQDVVAKARMWRWKPYGEVTLRFAQDANGAPVETLQDPLHYPHGTKWMAPGPLGQCHPLPDDANIRLEMARVAHNHKRVYHMYNFDWDPEPGSVEWVINQRIARGSQLQERQFLRLAGQLDEVEAQLAAEAGGAGGGGPQPVATVAEAPAAAGEASSSGGGGGGFAWPWQQPPPPQQAAAQQPQAGAHGAAPPFARLAGAGTGVWLAGPPSSASLSVGMGRASRAVLSTLSRAARRAPSLDTGRPRLSRPTRSKHSSGSSSSRQ